MDNKGQTLMIAILFGVFIFILGILIVINFIPNEVDNARASDSLDCSNTANISDGTKITCLIVDGTIPLLIITILSIAGAIISNRLLI